MGSPGYREVFAALGVLSIAAAPAASQAAPPLLRFAICKLVKDDGERLKCYDSAFEETSKAPAEQPVAESTSWRIEETKSPLDDRPQVQAVLMATDGKGVIGARCIEGRTEIVISPETFIGSSMQRVAVTVRINDAPAVKEAWSPSTTGRGAFSPSPVQTLRLLPDNGRLFLRVMDFQSAPHDMTFNLGKVSEIRDKIRSTCKWPDPKPAAAAAPTSKVKPEPRDAAGLPAIR